jgi:protease-4
MQDNNNQEDGKAWQLLETTLKDITKEQRSSRRWGIVFKSLTFLYIFSFVIIFMMQGKGFKSQNSEEHVAIIKVSGVIAETEEANANAIVDSLRKAFEADHSKAIVLAMNSPGGSPVQSAYVYSEINRLKTLHPDKKVYAVASDICASGCYYIAAAADFIYANPSSLVGSIGVTSASFGFVNLMEKLGVERRNYTAGKNKSFLDPFSPSKPKEVEFWNEVLNNTHLQFIEAVEQGRGDRLVKDEKLYSGLIWNGQQAKKLGLIDDFGSAGQVARDVIGIEEMVNYTSRKDPISMLVEKLGVSVGKGISQSLQNEHTVLQ